MYTGHAGIMLKRQGKRTQKAEAPLHAAHTPSHAAHFVRNAIAVWLLGMAVLAASVASLDDPFPTMSAIQQSTMPVADRYDLAARFYGVTEVAPPPTTPAQWQVGAEQPFYVSATATQDVRQIPAQLLALGAHVLVWGESALSLPRDSAQGFADRFDRQVYEAVTSFWGIAPLPGIDGDSRIHVLFTEQMPPGVAGYFSAQHTYPQAILSTSNQHEMIILGAGAVGGLDSAEAISIAAHEFQHLLRHQQDANETIWVDEGFSGLTQSALGFDTLQPWTRTFALHPQTQLNAWGTGDNRLAEYGAGFLFSLYFYERYGVEGLRLLSQQEADGLAGVDAALAALDGRSADDFFADWVLANLLRDHGLLGYRDLPQMPPILPRRVAALPYRFSTEERPYSTAYYELPITDRPLTVTLDLPESIPLIDFAPASGDWMWYSQRGDDSNPRLTRAFDLRGVQTATLTYRIWYELEEGWDYGYVSISADGGSTWEVQRTPQMTDDDPNRRAYAPGYTGRSLFWRAESLNLDAYAGAPILVRFEMVTDDAINQPGMALDDVRLEAVGYAADFEAGGGGWQAEGWIRTDNRLPPRAWVQAVWVREEQPVVTSWLLEGDRSLTLEPVPGSERLLLVISPLAPLTTEQVPYTLGIE